jgi:hypothetical protein
VKMHPDLAAGRPAPPPQPLWAPWETDGVTLHLVVRGGHPNFGACAVYDHLGNLRGPRIMAERARTLNEVPGSPPVCKQCVTHALWLGADDAHMHTRAVAAYDIRAELVCCDAYDVCRPDAFTRNDASYDPEEHPDYHAICYWGEAAARLAEDPDHEDCEHEGGSWFDRTLCAEPCGKMHDRCRDCGGPLDSCDVRARSYLTRTRPAATTVTRRIVNRLAADDASRREAR